MTANDKIKTAASGILNTDSEVLFLEEYSDTIFI